MKQSENPQRTFRKHVAETLNSVADERMREIAKFMIQEILLKARLGFLQIPGSSNQSYNYYSNNNTTYIPPYYDRHTSSNYDTSINFACTTSSIPRTPLSNQTTTAGLYFNPTAFSMPNKQNTNFES